MGPPGPVTGFPLPLLCYTMAERNVETSVCYDFTHANFSKITRKNFGSLNRIHRCFPVSSCVDAVPDTENSCERNYLPLKAVKA